MIMSTQSAPRTRLTHTIPQQSFRLLELPPDLADLLSSANAPILELKSFVPSLSSSETTPKSTATATDTDSDTSAEYVNLCTPTQTYRIRQVQSSNSLHIIRPSHGVGRHAGNTETDMDVDVEDEAETLMDAVTSIAKCGSTLELHTPPEGFSAVPFLKAMLRVYDEESGSGTSDCGSEGEGAARKKAIVDRVFADIPVSRVQCERGWVDVCAFVLPPNAAAAAGDKSCCWRPTPRMKLAVWKRLVEGSVLQGIDLGKQFLVRDLWRSLLDDNGEEPFPRALFEAVVRRVCEEGPFDEQQLNWASIDRSACVQWVGETYLEATASGAASAISQSEFLDAWKDQLPESWREDVSLSVLSKHCYIHPEPKTICFATEADQQKVKTTDTSASTAAKKSRNWHELFKNQKRQRR